MNLTVLILFTRSTKGLGYHSSGYHSPSRNPERPVELYPAPVSYCLLMDAEGGTVTSLIV